MYRWTAWVFVLVIVAGCQHDSGVVYQNSTIDALLDGNYDGEVSLGEVRRHGAWGLGTLQSLDGEMIALNGTFYQVRADGRVSRVPLNAKTPFAAVADISNDTRIPFRFPTIENYQALQKTLDLLRPSEGHAYLFVIEGMFQHIRTRSVPPQTQPYPPLLDAVAQQRVFDLNNTRGTMVGFWFPQSMQHVNVPGYHFHFLSANHRAGGHVLDVATDQVIVRMQEISEVRIALPRTPPTTRASAPTESELNRVER